jgi:hypothetical protein
MKPEQLIVAGAVYHLCLVVFHVLFWKIFRWRAALRKVDVVNAGVMQVMNVQLIGLFTAVAVVEFGWPRELLATGVGRAGLWAVFGFWALRAANQFVFFSRRHPASWAAFAVFLFGATIHAAALGG